MVGPIKNWKMNTENTTFFLLTKQLFKFSLMSVWLEGWNQATF